MVNIDLEHFGTQKGKCRATEQTIQDTECPWVQLRKKGKLEVPHVMVFINDPNESVIEPLYKQRSELEELYSTELMQNGGRLTGWEVSSHEHVQQVTNSLNRIQEE